MRLELIENLFLKVFCLKKREIFSRGLLTGLILMIITCLTPHEINQDEKLSRAFSFFSRLNRRRGALRGRRRLSHYENNAFCWIVHRAGSIIN
jgi:hypothetical protein